MNPSNDTKPGVVRGQRPRPVWRSPVIVLAALAAGLALIPTSCSTVTRTAMAPPHIPGATFEGDESCSQCHAEIVRDFRTASHARFQPRGKTASLGCEGCHGPGSVHNQSGGAINTIVNPKSSPEACFSCHLEMRGRFSLPHSHPVMAGKVSCNDCHDPHKGPAVKHDGSHLASGNATCLQCHPSQKGPHVFEHEALREGCVTCHNPHGSVNPRMLVQRNATLCLKCHFQQQAPDGKLVIGGRDHAGSMARGTCWSAGCHEAVHGSQVNSSLRF